MKKLLLFVAVVLLYSCNNSQEVVIEDTSKPIVKYVNKSYSHDFEDNEIVYLKPDSLPCFVNNKGSDHTYELYSLSKESLFNRYDNGEIDTTLIFPKRLK